LLTSSIVLVAHRATVVLAEGDRPSVLPWSDPERQAERKETANVKGGPENVPENNLLSGGEREAKPMLRSVPGIQGLEVIADGKRGERKVAYNH